MKNWTIEAVYLRPVKELFWDELTEGLDDDDVCAVVRGRMTDGRAFQYMSWVTREFLDDVGEERTRQILADEARPPEQPE